MRTYWKIFRLANVVEIITLASLIALGLYYNPVPVESARDVFIACFIFSIPLLTALNCIHNVILTGFLPLKKKLSTVRSISFWVLFVLFLLTIGLTFFSMYSIYGFSSHRSNINREWHFRRAFKLLALLIINLNGIYILFSQVLLVVRIRRNYALAGQEALDHIGSAKVF